MIAPVLREGPAPSGPTYPLPAWGRRDSDLDALVVSPASRARWFTRRSLIPWSIAVIACGSAAAFAVTTSNTLSSRTAQLHAANAALALEQRRNVATSNTLDRVNSQLTASQDALASAQGQLSSAAATGGKCTAAATAGNALVVLVRQAASLEAQFVGADSNGAQTNGAQTNGVLTMQQINDEMSPIVAQITAQANPFQAAVAACTGTSGRGPVTPPPTP
jgi:hypothetical protein